MAEIKLNTQNIAAAAVVIVAVIVGLGVWGSVQDLQQKVAVLDAQVAEIADIQTQLEDVRSEQAMIRTDMAEIRRARNDILRSICAVIGREPQQCGVPPQSPSP